MASLVAGEKARMYALSGVMRAGASRAGYVSSKIFVNIDGTQFSNRVLVDSVTITDELDETPNTASFRVNGNPVPVAGSELAITLGSVNSASKLFAGYALTVQQLYVGDKPANVQAIVNAVDYTWLFGFLKVTRKYQNQTASAIAADLIATYAAANGFTAAGVNPNLPALDEISFTNEDLDACLTRLARRIGAYWYVGYDKSVHLFLDTEPQRPAPEALTPQHKSLADVVKTADRTQVLTRVYVEGRGTSLLGPVAVGETLLPLEAVDMFAAASDVFAKVSPQGSEGGTQHLTFSGVVPGSAGSLVGPGIGPTSAPNLITQAGAGVDTGAHSYVTTFTTAAGESLPSPVATISTGIIPDPTVPIGTPWNSPDGSAYGGSSITIGDTLYFAYGYSPTTSLDAPWPWPVTMASANSTPIVTVSNNDPLNPTRSAPVNITTPYSSDPRVKSVVVWMRTNSHPTWGVMFTQANNPAGVTHSTLYGGYQATAPPYGGLPTSNTTGQNQVQVGIPTGAAAVTGRKLYRSTANTTTPLKLLTTIANNTATYYLDTTADASLGASAPASDTSGLQQTPGQVLPGAATIPIAGTAPFLSTGGWAAIGNGEQVIRYTGMSGSTLTGIPASGSGAIIAAVAYNSTVTAAPMLTGVSGISAPLVKGDEIYLVVKRDDTARQTALADMVNIGPGIREEWVQDRRLSIAEARARGNATLALRPIEDVTITYRCRDTRTASGQTITVNLPAPTNLTGSYKIQHVEISNFRPYSTQAPTYTVTASSRRFSFEDWLRRMQTDT